MCKEKYKEGKRGGKFSYHILSAEFFFELGNAPQATVFFIFCRNAEEVKAGTATRFAILHRLPLKQGGGVAFAILIAARPIVVVGGVSADAKNSRR